jgi:hypothetical protein
MLARFFSPLTASIKDFKGFRRTYGFDFDEVINLITLISTALGSLEDKGISAFLSELQETMDFLRSVNLQGLNAYESMKRIENEIKVKPWGIDIVEAINLLLLNKTKFSLMLEPPSPELELAGVEEV